MRSNWQRACGPFRAAGPCTGSDDYDGGRHREISTSLRRLAAPVPGARQGDAAVGLNDWTLRDLRRTAVTGIVRLGVGPHVVERILKHSTGTFGGVCNRFQHLPVMRQALTIWEAHVLGLKPKLRPSLVRPPFQPDCQSPRSNSKSSASERRLVGYGSAELRPVHYLHGSGQRLGVVVTAGGRDA